MNYKQLLKIRNSTGLNRNQFAWALGLDPSGIWRLENGEREPTYWQIALYKYVERCGILQCTIKRKIKI